MIGLKTLKIYIISNKKTDLDLELITQEEYDSIKNKLSRYITD
jgi:hypothetical protein